MKYSRPLVVACLLATAIVLADDGSQPCRLFIATDGNDQWSGTLRNPNDQRSDGPFATLEGARNEIRKRKKAAGIPKGGVVVELRGGVYQRNEPFKLTELDSGREGASIVYQAAGGEDVRIVGGKQLTGWKVVKDPAVLQRLDEAARGKVVQVDLRALGVTDYGSVKGGGLELFFQGKRMMLARWPNEGFVRIVKTVGGHPFDIRGTKGDKVGKFVYDGDRPSRWTQEKDAWLHGYWFWDWSDQRQKIESIDTAQHVIALVPPYHNYGYRKGQWYYGLNILAELDSPGEWYLDRDQGILYFWPPSPIDQGQSIVSVARTLLTLDGVSHVTVRGIAFEVTRGTAVTISQGTHCLVAQCTMNNLGGSAVAISGGSDHGVVGCDLYQLGDSGIALSGGNRTTLTPARHFALNNHIHHYGITKRMYSRAVSLGGVGNLAAHNLIHDAPHQAISFSGNDHVIEYNDIHDVCLESNDAGAIYSGRNWTMRGTVIRYNYLHNITGFEDRGCVGVYLDDMYCGTKIVGNVFYRVTRAAFIGGGRDVTIANNIFVDCKPALHIDARALGWAHDHSDKWIKEGREKGTLSGIAYNKPPYSTRYPKLVNILQDNPAAPKGNVVARNVCAGGQWDGIYKAAKPYVTLKDNLISEKPGFVDAAAGDFQLRKDSPAWNLGFQRIDMQQIGLVKDKYRATLPKQK